MSNDKVEYVGSKSDSVTNYENRVGRTRLIAQIDPRVFVGKPRGKKIIRYTSTNVGCNVRVANVWYRNGERTRW